MATEPRAVGEWRIAELIGAGSFATVHRATHVTDGRVAAVKEINTSKLGTKLRESLESEVSCLRKAVHPNIVRLLDTLQSPARLFLVLEFCDAGDLATWIRGHGAAPEPTAAHFLCHLAAGLRALRRLNVVHRDLKPQNLLLLAAQGSPLPTLKIADFGFARALATEAALADTLCGSPLYMAPEVLSYQRYDAKADLWSVGAILFELLAGRPPFGGANHVQLLRNMEKGEGAELPGEVVGASDACRHLVRSLLRRNPVERLSFEEFFRHPFLAAPGGSQQQRQQQVPAGSAAALDAAEQPPFALEEHPPSPQVLNRSSGGVEELVGRRVQESPLSHPFSSSPHNPPIASPPPPSRRQGGSASEEEGGDEEGGFVLVQSPPSSAGGGAGGQAASPGTRLTAMARSGGGGPPPRPPGGGALGGLSRRLSGAGTALYGSPTSQPWSPGGGGGGSACSPPSLRTPPQGGLERRSSAPAGSPLTAAAAALSASPSRSALATAAACSIAACSPGAHAVRASALQRCAGILDALACERAVDASPCEALSLYLLALACVRAAAAASQLAGAAAGPDGGRLARGGDALLGRALSLGADLRADAGGSVDALMVPDAWPLAHAAARLLGRRGAAEELLGSPAAAARSYGRALSLYGLMLREGAALPSSAATKALALSPTQRARLLKVAAALKVRAQLVCLAAGLPEPAEC